MGPDPAVELDWLLGSQAARLADWDTALRTGRTVAGPGPKVTPEDRTALRVDLSAQVTEAESLVRTFTDLEVTGFRSRAWIMGRGDWIRQNLKGLQRMLEPLAQRIAEERPSTLSDRPTFSRKALGVQVGGLLGYVARRVLGQVDVFLPPDDEGLIYFVGPNLVDVERSFALPPRDFRMWVAIHEVTHRVQFSSAPWLRTELSAMVDGYLRTVSLEPKEIVEQLGRMVEQLRPGAPADGPGGILRLLTPEQRPLFERTQAMMSLLEGHASYVMNQVAADVVEDLPRLRGALARRRAVGGWEKRVQRAIGFDQKIAQYDAGERFVHEVVERIGMSGFNLVWQAAGNLPQHGEIDDPDRWIARVAG
ncbi:MAG: zinc-dependent metalloprotease [Actinomycetota bacterium]